MSTPENTFITSVHKHLPTKLYRMKNHNQYNGGIPDCWYSGDKADLWVEYKYKRAPGLLTASMTPDLSALQTDWLVSRYAEGRNVAVIMGSEKGGVYIPGGLSLFMNLEMFRNQIETRAALAARIVNKCMFLTT